MTREEAIYEANENHNACYLDEFIEKIYDDFESRTCENCIHYINGYCRRDALIMFGEDFGCNRFERKTDVNV